MYSHRSWLIASNASNSPAQIVITFTKLPHQCCPNSDNALFLTSPKLSNFSTSFISQTLPSCFVQVGRIATVSLKISSILLLCGWLVKGRWNGYLFVCFGGFIDNLTIDIYGTRYGSKFTSFAHRYSVFPIPLVERLLASLNWLCTVVNYQLSLYMWVYLLPICSAPWPSSLSKYHNCGSQFLMSAVLMYPMSSRQWFSQTIPINLFWSTASNEWPQGLAF